MITKEEFMDILALHRQGHSMHSIAKRLGLHGLHRDSVKKYVLQPRIPEYRRANRRNSILAPFVPIIQDWLGQDNYRASWIFHGLKQIGFEGGYDTMKRFVGSLKEQQARVASLRFETLPGLQAQGDWADFRTREPNGRCRTVFLFLLGLGYSGAMYADFVHPCTLESFLDCHLRVFHYLGGAPTEVL